MGVPSILRNIFMPQPSITNPPKSVSYTPAPSKSLPPVNVSPTPSAPYTPASPSSQASKSPKQVPSNLPPGTPVGSGTGGGTLVVGPGGQVTEQPYSANLPWSPRTESPYVSGPSESINQPVSISPPQGADSSARQILGLPEPPQLLQYQPASRIDYPTPISPESSRTYHPGGGIQINPQTGKPYGTVSAAPGGIAGEISFGVSSMKTAAWRGEKDFFAPLKVFGLSAAGIGVGTIIFGKQLFTSPWSTISSTAVGVYTSVKGFSMPSISRMLTEPLGTAELGGKITGTYLTGKAIGGAFGFAKKPFQAINIKVNPKGVVYEETGIKVVESTTIPTTTRKLLRVESTKIDTIHATLSSDLKVGSILSPPADTSAVGPFRKSIEQYNFYQSIPSEGKPVFYGGYVGIGEGLSSKVTFKLLSPKAKGFIFREQFISETPSSIKQLGIKDIVKYQTTTPGTYVPGENIAGASIESQVTTSVGTKGSPIYKLAAGEGPLAGKFTYYNIKKPAPSFIRESPTLQKGWDVFTSRNVKIKFEEVKLEQIGKGTPFRGGSGVVDMGAYSESYGSRVVSASSIVKSFSFGAISSYSKSLNVKAYSSFSSSSGKSSFYSPYGISYGISGGGYSPPISYPSWPSGPSTPNYPSSPSWPSGPSTPSYPSTPILPPFKSPPIRPYNFGLLDISKTKSQSFGRGFRYTPSLAAIGLGITSPRTPKGIETGFILRPLITTKRRRRK